MKLFKSKKPVEKCSIDHFLAVLKVTSILSGLLYGRQGIDWTHHEVIVENLRLHCN